MGDPAQLEDVSQGTTCKWAEEQYEATVVIQMRDNEAPESGPES